MLEQHHVAGHQRGRSGADRLPEGKVPGHHGEHGPERLVAHEAFLGAGVDDLIGEEFLGIVDVIAAGRGAFGGFVDCGTKRLAHLQGHHLAVKLFFGFEDFGGLRHGLGALGKGRLPEAEESVFRALELFIDLRVGERLEGLDHLSGGRIGGGDWHG